MRKIAKYLFLAVMAAFALASCEKEKENPVLNPTGTPVKFTFSASAVSKTEAELKVVADVPVPADVTITLALDAESTWKDGLTFPSELVIAKGESQVTGKLTADTESLAPGSYVAKLVASVAGVQFGSAEALSINVPKPKPVVIDGDGAEWAKLPADYVTEMTCAADAELNGLKSAKVYYDDMLYVLLEVTDEALAKGVEDGKLRLHFFFDNGNDGVDGYYHKWSQPAIDCMLEGKMTSGGEWCALSSSYYNWTGEDPTVWSGGWTSAEASPTFEFAGKGNYYECAMDYKTYPGGLKDVIGMGFDIQDGGYSIVGFLPSAGTLAQVVKNGKEIPKPAALEIKIDGDFSEWKTIESVPGDGALKTLKMHQGESKMFFYLEIEKNEDIKDSESFAFAHKINLCFDNGDGKGDLGGNAWAGSFFDKIVDIWLMQGGVPNMITWGLDGFEHKESEADGIQKYEFAFNKSVDPVFSGDCLLYGAFINNQTCDNSSGSEVWEGESDTRIANAPELDQPMALKGELPVPELPAISIDGDMADWAEVSTGITSEDGPLYVFKVTYDENYIYCYNKRNWHTGLWGGGYFYFEFDTDNNPETGLVGDDVVNGNKGYGVETWMYLFLFGGSADAPEFNLNPEGGSYPETGVLDNIIANGTTDKETSIETEVRIPRANLGVKKGDIIRVYTWGNKSAGNLKGAQRYAAIRLAK